MEKIYSEENSTCKLAKASPRTVEFLLNYSRSIQIISYKDMQFESNLN